MHELSKLDIVWYSTAYGSSDFDVLVSEDGDNFTVAAEGLDDVSSVDLAGAKAQWVRIVINSINNAYYPVIREVTFSAE